MSTVEELVSLYESKQHLFEQFMLGVTNWLRLEPRLNEYPRPSVHSIRSRLKDPKHLADKLRRKENLNDLTSDNFFKKVTDLAGVRVLHIHQAQSRAIHNIIMEKISAGDYTLHEKPVAYSWDPDQTEYFKSLGLGVKIKPSHYTSIHYVLRPKKNSDIACEIQVRTLLEEVWGEIDHTINYPTPTQNFASKEQLRVLSKLVSTGSRLADSIFRISEYRVEAVTAVEAIDLPITSAKKGRTSRSKGIPPTN